MATLIPISAALRWYLRETPSSTKFTAETTNKVNILIANQITLNNSVGLLLQGASGGTEQAKIVFGLGSAPTGWTRDTLVTADNALRISSAGGTQSGSWTITGLSTTSDSGHTHDLGSHTHTYDHTHNVTPHNHSLNAHTHIVIHSHQTPSTSGLTLTSTIGSLVTWKNFTQGEPAANVVISHSTVAHTHTADHLHGTGGTNATSDGPSVANTNDASPAISTATGTTSTPSNNTAATGGSHTHLISQDAQWRPSYLNVIACKKD